MTFYLPKDKDLVLNPAWGELSDLQKKIFFFFLESFSISSSSFFTIGCRNRSLSDGISLGDGSEILEFLFAVCVSLISLFALEPGTATGWIEGIQGFGSPT
jgi:hypothetical protein